MAYQLMKEASDTTPIQHWAQGLAKLGQGALGGYQMYQADQKDKADRLEGDQAILALSGGGGTTAPASPAAAPGTYGSAISSIESGGKYDKLGPVTKSGDRAYGKYQVMGANVPEWTRTHLGQEMTPQAFLASPEAQDKVFNAKFGQYANKYGPEGAAKAWFAGERGMNNPNAKDQLGTTVSGYGQRFMKALAGGGAAPAIASVATPPQDPAALPPGAQPAQGYAVPGQPAQPAQPASQPAPQPVQRPAVDPRLIQILQNGTEAQKAAVRPLVAQAVMQQFKPLEKTEAVRNWEYAQSNPGFAKQQEKPPEHGDIGIDPATGLPVKGWIDSRNRKTEAGHQGG
jgi:hypothetical protein